MRRFFCDTDVFVYALGAEHAYRDACRAIIERQGRGALAGAVTSVVVSEFAHQRLRQSRDRLEAARRARQVAAVFAVEPVTESDLGLALDLYEDAEGLDAFDALLAAAALNRGVDAVLSADRAFDGIDALERIDPLDERALNSLSG